MNVDFLKKSLGVRNILARFHFLVFLEDTRENSHFYPGICNFSTPSPQFNVEKMNEFLPERTEKTKCSFLDKNIKIHDIGLF